MVANNTKKHNMKLKASAFILKAFLNSAYVGFKSIYVYIHSFIHSTNTIEHLLYVGIYIVVLVVQSCPTLCDPMDCSLPGSSVHEILQARILGWVAIPFSRGSSPPKDQTQVPGIAGSYCLCQQRCLKINFVLNSCKVSAASGVSVEI